MTVKSQKHPHKYYKTPNGVWACAFPNCTHFLPGNVEDTITNRVSVCWQCGEVFQMNEQSVKMDKPICLDCMLPDSAGLTQFLSDKGI